MNEEHLHVDFMVKDPESRNKRIREHPDGQEPNQTTWIMSFKWDKNLHPVGAYIEYEDGVSHKDAFYALIPHMWEAMQNPDDYDIYVGNTVEPIGLLTKEDN